MTTEITLHQPTSAEQKWIGCLTEKDELVVIRRITNKKLISSKNFPVKFIKGPFKAESEAAAKEVYKQLLALDEEYDQYLAELEEKNWYLEQEELQMKAFIADQERNFTI